MKKTSILNRVLTAGAIGAIVYLFFVQARLTMQPVPIAFDPTPIAFGYDSVTFSGKVYHDEGITPVGIGTGVALHINGSSTATTTTTAGGVYSFTSQTINTNDVLTVFMNNENEDGALVMKVSEGEVKDLLIQGMDIYKDRLILRTSTASTTANISTVDLRLADDGSDDDIDAVYTIPSGSNHVYLGKAKELFVWSTSTHAASGSIFTHDLDVRGTLTLPASANITASGSVVVGGTLTTTGDITLTSVESGEVLAIHGSSANNVYIDNGLEANFRLDEGTGLNASGGTINIGSGGSLQGGARWVQTNTGTTTFYNPYALEFDGVDDSVDFPDFWDLSNNMKRTFSIWFRRKSADTEDVIFAKKTSSGSATAGYMLYIDDESDKLNFEIADTSNTYTVTSTSTITDQNWHHVAVSFNSLNNNATNIFLDGAIDVSAKSGSMDPSTATFTNAVIFALGNDGGSKGPFNGTLDDFRIYDRALSGSELALIGTGEKSSGSGTYYIRSNIDINGDFGVYTGKVDVGTGYSINVAGDMSIYGTLKTNSGTITLDGSSQTLRGSTAFNQLAKTTTSEVTLTFETNTEQTVSGALTLQGAVSNPLNLRALYTGSQAYLTVEDADNTILKYLSVKDNNADNGVLMSCTEGCVDVSNNDNWDFLSECGDGVVSGSEECDDGNSVNTDSCPNDCRLAVCGDEVIEGTEECDPPNTGSCQSNCLLRGSGGGGGASGGGDTGTNTEYYNRPDPPEGCGNGILDLDKDEECDAGERFNGLGTCSYTCKLLICGDGIVSPQVGEDCEPTPGGTRDGVVFYEIATCGETCSAPFITKGGEVRGGCRRQFLQSCNQLNSSAFVPPKNRRCGNGIVETGEECDFGGLCEGGQFNGAFWTDRTSAATCTNGGGKTIPRNGDGCSSVCLSEFCGDGSVQSRGADNQPSTPDDEQCDNGSVCSNDALKSCRLDTDCGLGNTCEYHASKNRSCSATCKGVSGGPRPIPNIKPSTPGATSKAAAPTAECGNAQIESGEECDTGNLNGTPDSVCTSTCTKRIGDFVAEKPVPECGNRIVDDGEECDNGDDNSDTLPNACRTNCTRASCGDFVIDSTERCDSGDGNSDAISDTCRLNCQLPRCGDGVQDSGEECDGSFSCQPNCTLTLRTIECGNGVIERGEQCDDGNTSSGDGCSAFCNVELQAPKLPIMQTPTIQQRPPVQLEIDADVVVVNPTEYATAFKFIEGSGPCSTLTIKGKQQKAALIRAAAIKQKIPIVQNIALAREVYASINIGEQIEGELCTEINIIKEKRREVKSAKPSAPPPTPLVKPKPAPVQQPVQPVVPTAPTQYALPPQQYPYAQLVPVVTQRAPVGETGPAAAAVAGAGLAAGWSWIRRKRV